MNKSSKKATIFLVIVTYFSTLSQGKGSPLNIFILGTLSYVIVTFIMIAIPLIFKIKNKKKLDYLEGKRICLANSLLMFVIPIVLSIILPKGKVPFGIGGLGAIIYYYLNMLLFVEDKDNN